MKWKAFGLLGFCLVLNLNSAHAFMSTQESNEITPKGKFKLGFEPQVRTSNGTGTNFSGFFDTGINEQMSARAYVGSGDTDFALGGSLKWVPIPDYERQPAIGGKFSLINWREKSESFFTFRIEPIVSKKLSTEIGTFIPYASLPVMFNTGNDYNKTTAQVAFGSEFLHPEADNMTFGAELGFDAKDSFSYISGYVTIFLDDNR